MKKVKIMLLSLLVLAVAGGAMAFKAKRLFAYCTTATVNNVCPASPSSCGFINRKTITTDLSITPVCTTATVAGTCTGVTNCVNFTRLKTD